jgi:hypothetical protein
MCNRKCEELPVIITVGFYLADLTGSIERANALQAGPRF